MLCDVNEHVLNEKVAEINEKNQGKAIGVVCDVRDRAVETFGTIDVMANFAGGTAVRMQKVDKQKYSEFPDVPIDIYDWGLTLI